MSGSVEEWMEARRFNLAILYRTTENSSPATVLVREELCLVAPPGDSPIGETIRLADLHAFPLAVPMRNNNGRRCVAEVVAQQGCTLDVRFELDLLSTIISIVSEGKVCSILAPSAIQKRS